MQIDIHSALIRRGLAGIAASIAVPVCASTDITAFSLEQLVGMEVKGASRYVQQAIDAPASVSSIDAEDIRTFGYRTLADALRGMRGLQVLGDRSYERVGVRGFAPPGDYSNRVLLLVDGVRYNDPVYDQASIGGDFAIDMALVERIEYVAGPGSSVYGPNAFFGVINVITKQPTDLGRRVVDIEAGTAGRRGVAYRAAGGTEGGTEWMASVSRTVVGGDDLYFGEFDAAETNNGWARGHDGERITNALARIVSGDWTLTAIHGERYKGIPTASYGQLFNAGPSFTRDYRDAISVDYRRAMDGELTVGARVDIGSFRYTGDYVYDYPPVTVDRDDTVGRWLTTELQAVSTRFAGHTLVAGAEFRRDLEVRQRNFDVSPYYSYLDAEQQGTVWGIYVQDDMQIGERWSLSAGLRYNHHSTTGGTLNPRLAAIWKFAPATVLKLLHGTAYRPPNAYECCYWTFTPGGAKQGPALDAETIRSSEIVLEHAPGHGRRLLITAFHNSVDDLLISVLDPSDGMTFFQNVNGAVAKGIEAEAEYTWPGGTRLRGSASLQRTEDRSTGSALVNAPRRMLKGQLSMPLAAGLRLGVEAIGVGSRPSLTGRAPGYGVANVHLLADKVMPRVDLALGITNVFDHAYVDPGGTEHTQDLLPGEGRRVRLLASVRLD